MIWKYNRKPHVSDFLRSISDNFCCIIHFDESEASVSNENDIQV